MENVSKALLIAAGIFLAILLLSLLVIFYNQVSNHYAQKHELTIMEQAYKFNAKFENYNRDNIRGSDLISLMNMVIDYNATESYFEDKDYERIRVTIDLDGKQEEFKYYSGVTLNYLNDETITNTNSSGDRWKNDRDLVAITNTPSDLIKMAEHEGIDNMTDTKLQQLASKISTIYADENGTSKMDIYNRASRADLIKDLLGIELILNDNKKATPGSQSQKYIDVIKNLANQYYQYMQYKRAFFDCTGVIYDPDVNRIVEMNFKVQLDDDDHIVMN